jgi:hypothetical protein
MPLYRFYKLNQRRHIEGLPQAADCRDDTDAIAKAKDHASSNPIEIWCLGRCVGVIERGGEIMRGRDRT